MKEKTREINVLLFKSQRHIMYRHTSISGIHMDSTCKRSNVFSSRFMSQDQQGLNSKPRSYMSLAFFQFHFCVFIHKIKPIACLKSLRTRRVGTGWGFLKKCNFHSSLLELSPSHCHQTFRKLRLRCNPSPQGASSPF